MRKKVLIALSMILVFMEGVALSGCGGPDPEVKAPTGTYIGQENDGIEEYLGIRYGEFEPFKAPTDVTTTADDVIEAKEWGNNSLQPYDEVEVASQDPCSQDCLFLNVWTKDNEVKDKPVIFWIHGGSNLWGGGTDPMYDGRQFVKNLPEGEDCVFVTINYRLSFLGCADLSLLDGYTDEYKDAIYLRKLDQMQALKWVNENIEAWGGNKDNVTIMGQSAGGGAVCSLLVDPKANQYFNRVIECSGSMFTGTGTREQVKEESQKVFETLGVKSVEELVALSDEEISDKMTEINENAFTGYIALDDEIVSESWWEELNNGSAKDIDLMIGALNGEMDSESMDWENYPEPVNDPNVVLEGLKPENSSAGVAAFADPFAYGGLAEEYLALGEDKVKTAQDLSNDLSFGYPAYLIAEAQAKNNPNTYYYYWEYAPDKEKVIESQGDSAEVSPYSRAMHSMDVCFIFGTLEEGYPELTGDADDLPKDLVKETQQTWYSFAKTGDPNNEAVSGWKPFNAETESMMVIDKEANWNCKDHYRSDVFKVLNKMHP